MTLESNSRRVPRQGVYRLGPNSFKLAQLRFDLFVAHEPQVLKFESPSPGR